MYGKNTIVLRATNPDTLRERGVVLQSNRSMTLVRWESGDVTSIPSGWLERG